MKQVRTASILLFLLLACNFVSCGDKNSGKDYLLAFADTVKNQSGYKNPKGDIVIAPGKYEFCFTDTFRTYAIVLKSPEGFVAIDRNEKILYKVFPFDNGPDYTVEGMFRVIENNKIGYADAASGEIVIKPQFDCAFPFENGTAKVSTNCKSESDGEHSTWVSDNWYYIDKTGKKVDKK